MPAYVLIRETKKSDGYRFGLPPRRWPVSASPVPCWEGSPMGRASPPGSVSSTPCSDFWISGPNRSASESSTTSSDKGGSGSHYYVKGEADAAFLSNS